MKSITAALILCMAMLSAEAQTFEVVIRDNMGRMNMEQNYRFTNDSLVITAVSDNGRTHVNYLNRKLTAAEKKSVADFVSKFPVDSLREVYFDDYSNYTIIDEQHYPRSIDLMITRKETTYVSKATNAWVGLYNRVFELVNSMVPQETIIPFDKSKFNVFY
ncbi:MAG: hypothetical protein U0Y08_04200 [Bacteroidia bacterium]